MKKPKVQYEEMDSLHVAQLAGKAALDKKAQDLIILDVRKFSSFADYFVIMSGRSTRHTQGLAEAVNRELSQKRLKSNKSEGMQEGIWILLDYNDVVVHIFYEETRKFYDLEGLWHDSPQVPIGEKG